MRRAALWASAILGVVAIANFALALHRQTPGFLQVTNSPSSVVGGLRTAGQSTVWFFHSDGDHLGNGNTTPNIFLFDQTSRVKKGLLGIFQLTFGDQPSLQPTAVKRGRSFSFHSTDDLLGNGSTGRQVFIGKQVRWKVGVIPLFQITKDVGESFGAALNGNGKYVFFMSTGDMTSELVPAGTHIYRAEIRRLLKSGCDAYPCIFNPGLILVTPVEAFNPVPDLSGQQVVFESTEDAAGNGCANGARQLFVKNITTGITEQLTFGLADSRNAVINRNATRIVFESDADLLSTGSTRTQIYMIDRSRIPFVTTQLTFGTDGDSILPALSNDTSGRLVFLSNANLTGLGSAGTNQLFLLEYNVPRLTQLTFGTDNLTERPAAVFTHQMFASTSDIVGNGNTDLNLFIINTFPLLDPPQGTPRPSPTATPKAGEPDTLALALLTQEGSDNGNNTITTVVAATLADPYGNPVPDGTFVDFDIVPPPDGVVISDGETNMDPQCDVSNFELDTGVEVLNQPGVAHACLTYPGAEVGTQRTIQATVAAVTVKRCVGGLNDGLVCTANSACPGGECLLTPLVETGIFNLPPPVNTCEFNGDPCSDSNPCTIGDECAGGTNDRACVGGINAGAACNSASECFGGMCVLTNPPTCTPGTPIACGDDGDPCTEDVCNYFTGFCGVPVVCNNDGNVCTDDICDPMTGLCGVPNTDPCDDGDLCTDGDVCSAGTCTSGVPITCTTDGNPCTNDVCNPDTGLCGIPVPCVCL